MLTTSRNSDGNVDVDGGGGDGGGGSGGDGGSDYENVRSSDRVFDVVVVRVKANGNVDDANRTRPNDSCDAHRRTRPG